MSFLDDKREKKKALLKKNRRLQEIFNNLRRMRHEDERVQDAEEARRPDARPSGKSEEKEVWSAKTATIRNRLTDRKRTSKERWNRFSGTGGEGGRGL